ncbi:MAG: PEP-CTERM sorting domain-containing protein [Akkermansiaceae bacterium]|nr:PEP-CTERM sorting domain-containing protein [Akkermansiaceae bacterium]
MKTTHIPHYLFAVFSLSLGSAQAITIFTNGTTDFNTATNWDNGLPDNDAAADGADRDAVIAAGHTAVTSASYNDSGNQHYNLDVLGTLTVSAGHTVHLGKGVGYNTDTDLTVDGGTLNIDGVMTVIGGGAHTYVTNNGTINVRSGGLLDSRKNLYLTLGTLNLAADAASTLGVIDHLDVGSGSMIHFDITSTNLTTMILQNDLDLSAGGATLDLDITGATAGDSYTLFATGGVIDGTFTTFNYTANDSLVATLDYSSPTDLVVHITNVPEPSSAALLGLGGLALILRRRKG